MSQVVVIVGGGSLSPRAVEAVEDDAVIVEPDGRSQAEDVAQALSDAGVSVTEVVWT